MPSVALYQIDAFTDRPFAGNPAAVCPLDAWADDALLQRIAAENNLSETAFLVARADVSGQPSYELRWFTPTVEVDLCGHATLASSVAVFERLRADASRVLFVSPHSGELPVTRDDRGRCVLDFPARPVAPCSTPEGLAEALGAPVEACYLRDDADRELVARLADAATVEALSPAMDALARLPHGAVIVTAQGDGEHADVDFVSRFFGPRIGIPEDPVTGAAHCQLAPLWQERLGRADGEPLRARQLSARRGELLCTPQDERVLLAGHGVLVLEGTLRW